MHRVRTLVPHGQNATLVAVGPDCLLPCPHPRQYSHMHLTHTCRRSLRHHLLSSPLTFSLISHAHPLLFFSHPLPLPNTYLHSETRAAYAT